MTSLSLLFEFYALGTISRLVIVALGLLVLLLILYVLIFKIPSYLLRLPSETNPPSPRFIRRITERESVRIMSETTRVELECLKESAEYKEMEYVKGSDEDKWNWQRRERRERERLFEEESKKKKSWYRAGDVSNTIYQIKSPSSASLEGSDDGNIIVGFEEAVPKKDLREEHTGEYQEQDISNMIKNTPSVKVPQGNFQYYDQISEEEQPFEPKMQDFEEE
jgi:hypothetical protein